MENMVNYKSLFGGVYKGKKVLVTGHSGFKGSWLVLWLQKMGADVYGFSLSPEFENAHVNLLNLSINEHIGDIRNFEVLKKYIKEIQPELVFHLAAQALVRESYVHVVDTFSTNVMGTLHLLEACRQVSSVKGIINVTSDKCYENKEWIWGYRENDPMGGYDPYSASKGCAELVTSSYRNSFFKNSEYKKKHEVLLASARAGNVIGGGDWAHDRLIPDMVKGVMQNEQVKIRNPKATRPWQHVLEPLSGYLTLGWRLLLEDDSFAEGWNLGPESKSNLSVEDLIFLCKKEWNSINVQYNENLADHHEANLLMLDCSKANKIMKWYPVWEIKKTINKTVGWYKDYYLKGKINTEEDLQDYITDAHKNNIIWT
ncbi:CDP-glucose 4,6-dehydratase [Apibacter raozihei]|uniref:CDP-glucose 4,6-dehydratase n=1 Tax=Apibacter TaxID=1778601 RepID=UPI000FE31E43|nr:MULTISPECIES: CDP-glucose 4,6-dehydratase [Apibacter]